MRYTRHDWKRLTKQLNSMVDRDKYSYLQVEHSALWPTNAGEHGPNYNETGLLDFQTRVYQTEELLFVGGAKEYFTKLYLNTTVYNRDTAGTYLELRRDGKTYDVTLYDDVREFPLSLSRALGVEKEEFFKTDLNEYLDNSSLDVDTLKRQFWQDKLSSLCLDDLYSQDEFKVRLSKLGVKVQTFFRFTHEVTNPRVPHHGSYRSIELDKGYMRQLRRGIEFGWTSVGTYNALPNVVKVRKARKADTVQLSKLNVETSGYHSHSYKCCVPKGQAKKVKAFFGKRFRGVK